MFYFFDSSEMEKCLRKARESFECELVTEKCKRENLVGFVNIYLVNANFPAGFEEVVNVSSASCHRQLWLKRIDLRLDFNAHDFA